MNRPAAFWSHRRVIWDRDHPPAEEASEFMDLTNDFVDLTNDDSPIEIIDLTDDDTDGNHLLFRKMDKVISSLYESQQQASDAASQISLATAGFLTRHMKVPNQSGDVYDLAV